MQKEILYDEIFDAQAHYRLVLDSMARPGKINVMPAMELTAPAGLQAAGALVGFALLNADVSYYVEAYEVGRYLLVNTAARPEAVSEADYVFIDGSVSAELLRQIKVGTLPYPDEGATVVAAIDGLADEGEGLALVISGPGVAGEKILVVKGLERTFFEVLTEINGEFPLGIDFILTDGERRIACIPRSSKVRVN